MEQQEQGLLPGAMVAGSPADAAGAPASGWVRRFGWRNVAYVAFMPAVIGFGIALEATGPGGPDRGGGLMAGMFIWAIVSVLFFLVNAVLLVIALAKGRPAGKAFVACLLPFAVVLGSLVLEGITVN